MLRKTRTDRSVRVGAESSERGAASELTELEATLRVRAEVLAGLCLNDPGLSEQAVAAYLALGRFYAETLGMPKQAIAAYRRASEIDPGSTAAIRGARLLYTRARRYQKALRMLAAEQARVEDSAGRIELYREEAVLRRRTGDLRGQSQALRLALRLDPADSLLAEELGRSVLGRAHAAQPVDREELEESAELFAGLSKFLHEASGTADDSANGRPSEAPIRVVSRSEIAPRMLPRATRSSEPRLEAPVAAGVDERAPDAMARTELPPPADLLAPAELPEPFTQRSSDFAGPETERPAPSTEWPGPPSIWPGPPSEWPDPASDWRMAVATDARAEDAGVAPSAPDAAAPESIRAQGDGLIGPLFEALHTLEFLSDAHQGAEFVVRLLAETLKVEIGIVHLYDINSRGFVIASAAGPKASALLDLRCPETDQLIAGAMLFDQPVVITDALSHPATQGGRWALLDCARSILCAPLQLDGRFLGAIEVANPLDAGDFTADDVNALTYVATRLARFLAERGIVLSDDDVTAAE